MPSNKITSLVNSRVKRVVQLRQRRARTKNNLTIVEGYKEITRAVEAGIGFEEVYFSGALNSELKAKINALKVPIYETTKDVFAKISYGDRHDGILAVCSPRILTFAEFPKKKDPLYVVVESVETPGNLGAILRTCDGAGATGVIICDEKTDIYNPNVIRASLGTVFSVKVVVSSNQQAAEFLRLNNVNVCATLPQAKTVYTEVKLKGPLAIVVGSEQDGLTDFWKKKAQSKVKIPMRGKADSLNVSAATAILIYECIRQRP